MAKKPFMPQSDMGKSNWINNFYDKLRKYAVKYGISDDEINDMGASALYFSYWLGYMDKSTSFAQTLTAYKNEIRDGLTGNATSDAPIPPVIDNAPAAVLPGIFIRASALANRIKSHGAYTKADGLDLGLEGAEDNVDKTTMKPVFTIRLVAGGHPELVWTKAGMTGVEVWADRTNSGVFAMIDVDNTPNFTDMAVLPAQPALWSYKLIYRQGSNQIGHWSDVVSISVHG